MLATNLVCCRRGLTFIPSKFEGPESNQCDLAVPFLVPFLNAIKSGIECYFDFGFRASFIALPRVIVV